MYRQLTNRSAGVSVLVVIQLVEVQTIQEVIGYFSRRTAEPAAPRLGRYRLQDTDTDINSTHTYIHHATPSRLRSSSSRLLEWVGTVLRGELRCLTGKHLGGYLQKKSD